MSEPSSRALEARTWRHFLWLYAAEMLSITGTGLSAFALGAWVYSRTGSTTSFALLSVAAILPGHLLLPFGGVLADILPRRAVMACCNLIAGACAITLAMLLWRESLRLDVLYILLAISALCRALQWITFTATMTDMVPERRLSAMSSWIYLGEAGQQILAPALAAMALPLLGWSGVIMLDVSTFAFAAAVLLALPIPALAASEKNPDARRSWRDTLSPGWRFIWRRKGLLFLQLYFALSQFFGGFLAILVLPLLMELTGSARQTGVIMGIAGAGMIAGVAVLGKWHVSKKRARWTIIFDALSSATLITLAITSTMSPWLVAAGGFLFLFMHAIESGVSQDLWQRIVPSHLQGRVFAIRRFISWSLVPVCYLVAGPLVDDLFSPLMSDPHHANTWFCKLFGTGTSGAILFLIAIAASLRLILAICSPLARPLFQLDDLLDHPTP